MNEFLEYLSSEKPHSAEIGDSTTSDLYEYAYPSDGITVVKIVSAIIVNMPW